MFKKFLTWALNSKIKKKLPQPIFSLLKPFWFIVSSISLRGTSVSCPVCEKSARDFVLWGENKICPRCGSLERQRTLALWLSIRLDILNAHSRVLHVAPDKCLVKKIKSNTEEYISIDLYDPNATLKADLTNLPFPNNTFDLIICSHVLEHIPDDRKAMEQLGRVLKKDGEIFLLVPLKEGETIEDLSINDPNIRTKLYGQSDHVRFYGLDIIDRLKGSGLKVETLSPENLVKNKDELNKMGLLKNELFFVCKKS